MVTAGTFNLDGGTWEVESNVWVIGDDEQCVVIDAAHDATPILRAVEGHGDDTTVGDELPELETWIARGR